MGTVYARHHSILVNFDDGDEGAIAALTCGSTIVLLTRPFKDDEGLYLLFTQALQAVIPIMVYNLAFNNRQNILVGPFITLVLYLLFLSEYKTVVLAL